MTRSSSRLLATVLALSPALALAMPGATPSRPAAAPSDGKLPAPDVTQVQLTAPLFAPEFADVPVASVETEIVTLGDFARALAQVHESHAASEQGGKKDFATVLDRLVDGRLFVLEAREMGIDDLPEVKSAVSDFEAATQREMLQAKASQDAKADPAVVERLFQESVRERKLMSALFAKEVDAQAISRAARGGLPFEALLEKAKTDKQVKSGGEAAQFVPEDKLLPEVRAVVVKLKDGEVSEPVRLTDGWTVLKAYEVRYPEDAKARARAEAQALQAERKKVLMAYYGALVKKRVKIEQKVLNSLDFEARKPGIAALQKDKRVVARIEGAEPITVGELAKGVLEQFFHGFDRAAKEKKVNRVVVATLDALVSKKVIPLAVKAEGIPETPEYRAAVEEFHRNVLFSKFVEKVLMPEVNIPEDDAKAYHAKHKAEYKYPGFYRVQALAFASTKDAQAALDKLRGGTDFKWLSANAENQLPAAKQTLHFEGTLLAASALPEDVQKALSGAQPGDHRLFAAAASEVYVLRIDDVIPAREQTYEEAREAIFKKLFGERLGATAKDWTGKMRKAREVKVYLTRVGS